MGGADLSLQTAVARRVSRLRERVASACRKAGRDPETVRIVGVTKYSTPEQVRALIGAGISDLGENRAGAGAARRKAFSDEGLRWHMIGRLQTNKAAKALEWADILHSLDRPSLAEKLQKLAESKNQTLPVFVQVNVNGEVQKAGMSPEEVESWAGHLREHCPRLPLEGLMTMAPYGAGPEECRGWFRQLRELAERCGLGGLSMGMSGDFETAIEEGATIIRVGSVLFDDA